MARWRPRRVHPGVDRVGGAADGSGEMGVQRWKWEFGDPFQVWKEWPVSLGKCLRERGIGVCRIEQFNLGHSP
jgi:hypothetical protein